MQTGPRPQAKVTSNAIGPACFAPSHRHGLALVGAWAALVGAAGLKGAVYLGARSGAQRVVDCEDGGWWLEKERLLPLLRQPSLKRERRDGDTFAHASDSACRDQPGNLPPESSITASGLRNRHRHAVDHHFFTPGAFAAIGCRSIRCELWTGQGPSCASSHRRLSWREPMVLCLKRRQLPG